MSVASTLVSYCWSTCNAYVFVLRFGVHLGMVDDADATMGIGVLDTATLVDTGMGIGVFCNYFYNFIVRVPLERRETNKSCLARLLVV
jgi:hypothetical protein